MAMDTTVFARRARRIEWILLDVDGVLTDGTLLYTRRGEQVKAFNAKDGMGLALARQSGLKVGLLSGRRSPPLERRAADLDLDAVILGSRDKRADFKQFLDDHATTPGKVAFAGDDLPDLPVLGLCALSFAPADAVPEVRAMVHVVLEAGGGQGAAREMVERILKARGEWEGILSRFSVDL